MEEGNQIQLICHFRSMTKDAYSILTLRLECPWGVIWARWEAEQDNILCGQNLIFRFREKRVKVTRPYGILLESNE